MHGSGKFTWADGRQYVGEYFEDKKEGDEEGKSEVKRDEFNWSSLRAMMLKLRFRSRGQ